MRFTERIPEGHKNGSKEIKFNSHSLTRGSETGVRQLQKTE
jgi:hypothetical protein